MNEVLLPDENSPAPTDWDILCHVENPATHLLQFALTGLLFVTINTAMMQAFCLLTDLPRFDGTTVCCRDALGTIPAYLFLRTLDYGLGWAVGFFHARFTYLGSSQEKYINAGAA